MTGRKHSEMEHWHGSHGKQIIRLHDVRKIYLMGEVEVHALRGINLNIMDGEFMAIVGPSGSGKSTLLNMIGCLDLPTSGRIELNGVDITELSESDLAQLRGKSIGFIFQFFNLLPSMTALENVALPLVFQGVPRSEREERAAELLKALGLGDRMDHRPSELSGGEQQRVAIARALAPNPKVILADEPTGNLDLKAGEEIMRLLNDLHVKEKKTIIIVTHDKLIADYTHRIVKLRDGKIVHDGVAGWNDGKRK
ncbi:MAG: ABC transporter ATP-binding protein [Candidatus Micrarchaeia archaeon]